MARKCGPRRYKLRSENHLCWICGEPIQPNLDGSYLKRCPEHQNIARINSRKCRQQRVKNHQCVHCGAPVHPYPDGSYSKRCPKHWEENVKINSRTSAFLELKRAVKIINPTFDFTKIRSFREFVEIAYTELFAKIQRDVAAIEQLIGHKVGWPDSLEFREEVKYFYDYLRATQIIRSVLENVQGREYRIDWAKDSGYLKRGQFMSFPDTKSFILATFQEAPWSHLESPYSCWCHWRQPVFAPECLKFLRLRNRELFGLVRECTIDSHPARVVYLDPLAYDKRGPRPRISSNQR